MKTKKRKLYQNYIGILIAVVSVIVIAIASFAMANSIRRRMKESATSNLLNFSQVIRGTMEEMIEKDLQALKLVADFKEHDQIMDIEHIRILCDSFGFDWVAAVDVNGEGLDDFSGLLNITNIPCYQEWTPRTTGYSNPYIGESGRSQIVLWVPIFYENNYYGTVFGSVILNKYYSASVFTFYEGDGRTYLFNATNGDFILKSLGVDGTSVRQTNIYSLLLASNNKEEDIADFKDALSKRQSGTAQFNFNGETSYLCFLPITSSSNWYITTVVAEKILLKESAEIQNLVRFMLITVCITVGITSCCLGLWLIHKTKMDGIRYRNSLFSNLSQNLDSAFLIYEKHGKTQSFVSDNVNRLLGLDKAWLEADIGNLFDWCGIPKDDSIRMAFINGTLGQSENIEVRIEDEVGEQSRTIRLELIANDLEQEIAVVTDITKERQTQDSLISAMKSADDAIKAKNEFLSSMSHDLKTPINGVIGMTTIALANISNQEKVYTCLTKISDSTTNLLDLINEILDMSKIEKGKARLNDEPINITELFKSVLNINYPGLQSKHHTVDVRIGDITHEAVIGDSLKITRIATNLISNAIKYTPEGGNILLSLTERPQQMMGYGCYELIVKDNGMGMSKEFLEKGFEPFERDEDVKKSDIQGTGLGLLIVKNLVNLMSGSISVESEKGSGSTFTITLNLKLNKDSIEKDYDFNNISILVVDTDDDNCKTITEVLTKYNAEIQCATSAEAVLEEVEKKNQQGEGYRFILIDSRILTDKLMSNIRSLSKKRVMIISMNQLYNENEQVINNKAVRTDGQLMKPISKSKLLKTIQDAFITNETDSQKLIPSSTHVLLVEDNELNKEIAMEFFKMIGVKATWAKDGVEAVKLFEQSQPGDYQIIFMDIQMPKLNGYAASKMIRNMDHSDAQTIPIVAMTADAFKDDRQLALEAGMNDYCPKPISIARLTEILVRYLK